MKVLAADLLTGVREVFLTEKQRISLRHTTGFLNGSLKRLIFQEKPGHETARVLQSSFHVSAGSSGDFKLASESQMV
jgi:hypothetical protein